MFISNWSMNVFLEHSIEIIRALIIGVILPKE